MRRLLLGTAALALVFGACSDDGGEAADAEAVAETTTTTEPTTTTTTAPPTPEEAFEEELDGTLDTEGSMQEYVDFGVATCESMQGNAEIIAESDAPNATPETAAAITGVTTTMMLSIAYDAFDDPAVSEVFLRAMAGNLCPEFSVDVEDIIEARGGR